MSVERDIDYPEETEGSKLARYARQLANKLTSDERKQHWEQAMAKVNAGARRNSNAHATMATTLTSQEEQVLKAVIQIAGGINRPIRFRALRDRGFPELVEQIYCEHPDYLDSLANRKLQILRDKGWISIADATIIVVADILPP